MGRSRPQWQRQDLPPAPALRFRVSLPRHDARARRTVRPIRPSPDAPERRLGEWRPRSGFPRIHELPGGCPERGAGQHRHVRIGERAGGAARLEFAFRHRRRPPGRTVVSHAFNGRAAAGAHCPRAGSGAEAAAPGRAVHRPGPPGTGGVSGVPRGPLPQQAGAHRHLRHPPRGGDHRGIREAAPAGRWESRGSGSARTGARRAWHPPYLRRALPHRAP